MDRSALVSIVPEIFVDVDTAVAKSTWNNYFCFFTKKNLSKSFVPEQE